MKRIFCLFLCGLLMCALFSGCGQKDPLGQLGDLQSPEDPDLTQAQDTQELTLTYYPERSMNPLESTDYTNRALFSLLYQSLFVVTRDYTVEPILCARYSVSEDMRAYTFYPENATFSDGSRLSAVDVLASLQAAQTSDYYKGRFSHISGMALSGDGGVTVSLTTPYENLPLILDIPIVPAGQVSDPNPLGTGPYTLDDDRLRRRSDWWCSADMAVTAPSIPLVRAESPEQIWEQFHFDHLELDLACADPSSDRYVDFRCDYELWDSENGMFLYLACNMDSLIFSNDAVRAALTYAIDRSAITDKHYYGFARSTTLPASPLSPYYNQTLAQQYSFDSMRFTKALQDQGLAGATIRLLTNKDDSRRLKVAKDIAKMLTDCGVKVELLEYKTNNYIAAVKSRNYDLYLGQTKLSANMDLSPFFDTYGALSYGGINDLALYNLCQQALANHGNYYSLHQSVMKDGRLCPILFHSYAIFASRGVLSKLTPARDNVFFYSLGKTMEDAKTAP